MLAACAESDFSGGSGKRSANTSNSNPTKTTTSTVNSDPTSDDMTSGDGVIDGYELCSSPSKKTKTVRLDFPADNTSCQWGQNGNTYIVSGSVMSALEPHYMDFNLDSTVKKICSMNISTTTANFAIDDEAFVTISDKSAGLDYLIYSDWYSMDIMGQHGMSKSKEVYVFEKSKILGLNYKTYPGAGTAAFACASGVSCDGNNRYGSNGGIAGAMVFSAGKEFLKNLPDTFLSSKDFKFGLWNSGNNDASDCKHSAISFDIKIDYVE